MTYFLLKKISIFVKQINALNGKITSKAILSLEAVEAANNAVKFINKIFAYTKNEKILTAKKITQVAIIFIQLFLLYKSLDFSEGKKVRLRNVKKILLAGVTREILKKLRNHVCTRYSCIC